MARFLLLPQIGVWAARCLRALQRDETPDLTYLAAAIGHLSDSIEPYPDLWLRAEHDGLTIAVTLDAGDPYLDLYGQRATPDPDLWQHRLDSVWRLLVEGHRVVAEALAAAVNTLVPLESVTSERPISATSGWAFGAIALALPADTTAFAEALVHELQHLLLGALCDLIPLTDRSVGRVGYAPWRGAFRPMEGLLQGCYAYLGVIGFWRRQRATSTGDDRRHAEEQVVHWLDATIAVIDELAVSDALTAPGALFVDRMRRRLARWRELDDEWA